MHPAALGLHLFLLKDVRNVCQIYDGIFQAGKMLHKHSMIAVVNQKAPNSITSSGIVAFSIYPI